MPPATKPPLTRDEVIDILSRDYAMDCSKADPSLLMQIPDPSSFAKFGRLMLKMALGELDPRRIPDDVMRQVLAEIGIAVPDDWKIRFARRPKKTFVAMIPPADMARAALCRLQDSDGDYALPPQYADWVNGTSADDVMGFYAFRVGDYTLNFCR
jgi:hypothetical protein